MATKRTRTESITLEERTLLRRALMHRGIFQRVARKLRKSHVHVGQVARGKRQSRPVVDALVAEIRRIERESRSAA
jgi:hypothetical protein